MRIELKEHELEQALESYFRSLMAKPVSVLGFDLTGMRSRDGLSAMIEIEIDGETNVREPKQESSNVHVTNTSWRSEKATKDDSEEQVTQSKVFPDLQGEDLTAFQKALELLTNNPRDIHADEILDIYDNSSEVVKNKLSSYPLFVDMKARYDASIESVAKSATESVNTNVEEPITESEPELPDEDEVPLEPETNTEPEPEQHQATTVKHNLFGSPLGSKPANVQENQVKPRPLFK